MMTIKVIDIIGNPCLLAPEKGDMIASAIQGALKEAKFVRVDFTGYKFISSAFLNHAFGQLCIDLSWTPEAFSKNIEIVGLDEDDAEEVLLAIDNAQIRIQLLSKGIKPEQYFARHVTA
jgi:hypothetical protein